MKKLFIFSLVLLLASCKDSQNKSAPQEKPLREQIEVAYNSSDWETVVALTDSVIQSGEPYSDLILAYAQSWRELGYPEKSVQFILGVVDNEDVTTPKEYLYHELGVCLSSLGKYDEAISAFSLSNSLNIVYPRPLIGLADAYEHKGDMEKAVEYYYNAGMLLYEQKFVDETLSLAVRCTEIAPDNPLSWELMAKYFHMIQDQESEDSCLAKMHSLKSK